MTEEREWYWCMMCNNLAVDAFDFDEDGTRWCYCRKCDCWTEHPALPEWKAAAITKEGETP